MAAVAGRKVQSLGSHRGSTELRTLEPMMQSDFFIIGVEERDEIWCQSHVELLINDNLELTVNEVAQVCQSDFERIHSLCYVATVEVAAALNTPIVEIEQRVVIGGIHLNRDPTLDPFEGVAQCSDDVRRASDRVAILDLTV